MNDEAPELWDDDDAGDEEQADRVFVVTRDADDVFHFEEYTGRDLPDGAIWENWGQVYDESFDLYRLPGTDVFGLTFAWQMMLEDLAGEEYGDDDEDDEDAGDDDGEGWTWGDDEEGYDEEYDGEGEE